jgi:hypothetical protein
VWRKGNWSMADRRMDSGATDNREARSDRGFTTMASYRNLPEATPRQSFGQPSRTDRGPSFATAGVGLSLLLGMFALAHSYAIAQYHLTSTSQFIWFWAGMLLLTLPIIALLARRSTRASTRTTLLTLYGILTYAPKLLRNPSGPLYYDEFAHYRATYDIIHTGKLFTPNPLVPIVAYYPGMHAATAALVNLTGLSIWQAAIALLLLCHIFLVLGIAMLAEALGLTRWTASLSAVFYSLNSSFLYFDTQFAYESMAITFAVWTLVAYVHTISARTARDRITSAFVTCLLFACTLITHHLSTFTLVVIMTLIALGLSIPQIARGEQWVRTAATAWALTLFAFITMGFWFVRVAPGTISYLTPFISQGLSQLMSEAQGSAASQKLFSASLSPWWEQKSAYVVVLLALGIMIGGVLFLRSRMRRGRLPTGHRRALWVSLSLWGLAYFPSTVFILSAAGSQGARRSWAFTWIGLALAAGPAMAWLIGWARDLTSRWLRTSAHVGFAAAVTLGMMGGTAAGVNVYYRFPGPYQYGSDTRDITPELYAASAWFRKRFGIYNNIVIDRYSGVVFASYGLQNPATTWTGFPTYELYLANLRSPILQSLLGKLKGSDFHYVIVDRRMAYYLPEVGVYFDPGEPASLTPASGKSPFYGKLQKFDSFPWLTKVFQSDNYIIYRIVVPDEKLTYGKRLPTEQGKLVVAP